MTQSYPPHRELAELIELIDRALALADRLDLKLVGISLDSARLALAERGGERAAGSHTH